MCIPFRVCPDLILPTFIVNNTVIPISGDRQDAYYISEGKFCFSKLQTNMILYETCVTQSTCSVCSNYTGEMVIMSRSQLTVLTSESGYMLYKT